MLLQTVWNQLSSQNKKVIRCSEFSIPIFFFCSLTEFLKVCNKVILVNFWERVRFWEENNDLEYVNDHAN